MDGSGAHEMKNLKEAKGKVAFTPYNYIYIVAYWHLSNDNLTTFTPFPHSYSNTR